MTPAAWYQARIAHWTAMRDAANRRGVVLSRLRLVSFLGGVGTGITAFFHTQSRSREIRGRIADQEQHLANLRRKHLRALVPFDVRHARTILLDDAAV